VLFWRLYIAVSNTPPTLHDEEPVYHGRSWSLVVGSDARPARYRQGKAEREPELTRGPREPTSSQRERNAILAPTVPEILQVQAAWAAAGD
jgi:hypothetical protein